MSMDLPLLWHIPLSHFNEKVRWALDFKSIPHRRERVGADYLFKAWRATGHGTLPILFLDGQPIRDSTAIIAGWSGDTANLHYTLRMRRSVAMHSSSRTILTRCWVRACVPQLSRRCSKKIPTSPCAC